MAQSPS